MPSSSFARASSLSARRPAMMTFLPRVWKRRAKASPMPEVAPMMRMVLSFEVMVLISNPDQKVSGLADQQWL